MDQSHIRNFCIIAHIDHGKSTLADRLLEYTGTISKRDMAEQVLDQMDLEREKGITIKAQAVRMRYTAQDGPDYELNLVDTPAHVDFNYEVSRSLGACEGAILVVDASQGIEAQTLANLYLAIEADLAIIPVINKIDLPSAEPDKVAREIEDVIGIARDEIVLASAKEGIGTQEILEAVIRQVPPPHGAIAQPLRALVFDSKYDAYKGVIAYLRVMDGVLARSDRLLMMQTGSIADVLEVGYFSPNMVADARLAAGEVGYVATGFKNVKDCQVGDTVTLASNPADEALPGYRPAKPMVFAGIFPVDGDDYPLLRDALDRLKLNDASLVYEPENSVALGFRFRCGFLGLLHMEIVQERLEREFGLNLITTAPSVRYRITRTDGSVIEVDSPAKFPNPIDISKIEEPIIKAMIITNDESVGGILQLSHGKRGTQKGFEDWPPTRVMLTYELPLNEIVLDFYDRLKSVSRGYASLDYHLAGYSESDLVKLDVLVGGEPVDALSMICHREQSYERGRDLVSRLRKLIPRQMFEVPIQAAIGSRVI